MSAPIRILHVVGAMNRGGVETWLMRVMRVIDRARFRFDFLVHTEHPAVFDEEIRSLDGRIFPCLHPRRPLAYARALARILREQGPFDVVHSHVHHFSGNVLRIARRNGIRRRIAHSHNDTRLLDGNANWPRAVYLRIMKSMIRRNATAIVGASSEAAKALFGNAYDSHPQYRQIFYGIDCNSISSRLDRTKARAALGLPRDAYVVGHVARFDPQKNHAFLLEIANELTKRQPRTHFLLVGDGPLRRGLEEHAQALQISDRVHFLGLRADVLRLLPLMDVFVLPSFYEGLPVAALEAQATGLPMLVTDTITREMDVIPELVRRRPLSDGAARWADSLSELQGAICQSDCESALRRFRNSPFNIRVGVSALEELYEAR